MNRFVVKFTKLVGVVLVTLISLLGCEKQSASTVLRVGHTLDTQHSVHLALKFMAKQLSHYSNGEMTLKIYANGQLGSEREMVELLQIGSLAMTKVSAATLEGFVEDMGLFGLPYVFQSRDHRWKVLNSDVGQQILSSVEHSHLIGMGYMDAGSRSFYTCEQEINSPEDLAGKKIRVMNSQNAVNMVNNYGGAATPMAWGELYAALQQQVVDGAENNPPSYYSSRHYEVCKHFTLNEHTSIPDVVIASKHVFKSLTAEQQGWLTQAMHDATEHQKALWFEAEQQTLEILAQEGVTIIVPDKAPFIAAARKLHQPYIGTKIGQYLETIQNISH